jgi:hypothetical protein
LAVSTIQIAVQKMIYAEKEGQPGNHAALIAIGLTKLC